MAKAKTKRKPISKGKLTDKARTQMSEAEKLEQRLMSAAEKAKDKVRKKLEKPLTEMSQDEILFLDKDIQVMLGPQDKAVIGRVRREKIMEYLLKVETGELDMKRHEIAKAVNITPSALSTYVNDPDFQAEYMKRCKKIVEAMQSDRVTICRKIASNSLNELLERTKNGKIHGLNVKQLIDLVSFSSELMRKELGEDVKTTKVIHEGSVDHNMSVETKEAIQEKEFRSGMKDLLRKTKLQSIEGGRKKVSGGDD